MQLITAHCGTTDQILLILPRSLGQLLVNCTVHLMQEAEQLTLRFRAISLRGGIGDGLEDIEGKEESRWV
ncbi:MAG: hypothetical protein U5K37_06240 [Natrialbaceae archaeon]|nr:hypothetical protein [Natrialbaceae archaeon]